MSKAFKSCVKRNLNEKLFYRVDEFMLDDWEAAEHTD